MPQHWKANAGAGKKRQAYNKLELASTGDGSGAAAVNSTGSGGAHRKKDPKRAYNKLAPTQAAAGYVPARQGVRCSLSSPLPSPPYQPPRLNGLCVGQTGCSVLLFNRVFGARSVLLKPPPVAGLKLNIRVQSNSTSDKLMHRLLVQRYGTTNLNPTPNPNPNPNADSTTRAQHSASSGNLLRVRVRVSSSHTLSRTKNSFPTHEAITQVQQCRLQMPPLTTNPATSLMTSHNTKGNTRVQHSAGVRRLRVRHLLQPPS
jgi:hypothetical protein